MGMNGVGMWLTEVMNILTVSPTLKALSTESLHFDKHA